jgi:hypothetical protein
MTRGAIPQITGPALVAFACPNGRLKYYQPQNTFAYGRRNPTNQAFLPSCDTPKQTRSIGKISIGKSISKQYEEALTT